MCGDVIVHDCGMGSCCCIQQVEDKGAAKHFMMHKTSPLTLINKYLAQNVNSDEAEKS